MHIVRFAEGCEAVWSIAQNPMVGGTAFLGHVVYAQVLYGQAKPCVYL